MDTDSISGIRGVGRDIAKGVMLFFKMVIFAERSVY